MDDIQFLIISENEQYIAFLKNLIQKIYPKNLILSQNDGLSAWELIKKYPKPMIIISSIQTPSLNGFQVLKKVKELTEFLWLYFILISEKRDKEINLKIIAQGVDDYLPLPFSVDEIVIKLKSAFKYVNEIIENRKKKEKIDELNEQLFIFRDKTIDLIQSFIKIKLPGIDKSLLRFKESSAWIADKMNINNTTEIENISLASGLIYTYKLFLTESQNKSFMLKDGHFSNETFQNAFISAKEMLSKIWGIEQVIDIFYHVYENFDGTGFPDGKKAWEIPIGSRIIRVLIDYEEKISIKKIHPTNAIDELFHEQGRFYDFKVIALFDQNLATLNPSREKTISVKDLKENLVISRNIITESGVKVIGAGIVLTTEKLEKLKEIIKNDPVIGDIYVSY